MSEFLTLVTQNGVTGLVTGLFVLLFVFGLSYGQLTVTGGQKRTANVILSIFLSGVSLVNPENPNVLVAAIASVSSALAYEFILFLGKQAEARKKKAEAK